MFVVDVSQGTDGPATFTVWCCLVIPVDTGSCEHGDCRVFPVVQQLSRRQGYNVCFT